jgi:hypothetical protein
VHAGVHVAGVDGVDPQGRLLGAEYGGDLIERGLGGAVAAPTLVGLDRGVGGDEHQPGAGAEMGEEHLGEPQGREDVDGVDLPQLLQRVVGQRGLGAGPEQAGVVDGDVEATGGGRRLGQGEAVFLAGHVAGPGDDGGELAQLGRHGLEGGRVTAVDDEVPPVGGQAAGQGEAQAPGGARDEGARGRGCPRGG